MITTRALTPRDWPIVEQLFGEKGACGGCWCQYWRLGAGERWDEVKGDEARRRFRAQVRSGEARGVLAFDGDQPVGWCAAGPRPGFLRLDRSRTLACDDADRVWSLPCFFVRAGWRGRGVATALLDGALALLREAGAEWAEGYPVRPKRAGQPIPAAFAWTGTRRLFDAAGFSVVGNQGGGKERVRLALAPVTSARAGRAPSRAAGGGGRTGRRASRRPGRS